MMCLIILLCVIAMFIGFKTKKEDVGGILITAGFLIGALFTILALIYFIPCTIESKVIDDKIAMYEEENAQIEEDVEQIVIQYQQHEKAVFDMSEIHSATTLIQMYPDLKSNNLAMKQIEIYNKNNAQIKSLKLDQIDCEKAKWWLYFGKVGE